MDQTSPQQRRSALRLILGAAAREAEASAVVVSNLACNEMLARQLRAEAIEIEAWYGANAYSRFLFKHGRRPDPTEAATIGCIIGTQVKASDGTMQPRLTKAERAAIRGARKRRKDEDRRDQEIEQIAHAVMLLSKSQSSPDDLVDYANSHLDESRFGTLAHRVLALAHRFAEGLARGKTANRTPKPA